MFRIQFPTRHGFMVGAFIAGCVVACGTGDAGSSSGGTGSGGSGGGSGTGGAGGATACQSGETCVGALPLDWQGPVVVFKGDVAGDVPACPPAFGSIALDAFEGLGAAEPAACTCSCANPTGAKCSSQSSEKVQMVASNQVACGNTCSGANPVFDGTCLPVIQGTCGGQMLPKLSQNITLSPPDITAAKCEPTLDKTVAPVPAFASKVRACAADAPAACAEGLCISGDHGAYGAAVCVLHAGDVACPDAIYSSKTLVHASAEDTRDCEPCACGAPAGIGCTGMMTAHSSAGCGDNLGSWAVPGCVPWLPTPGTKYIQFNLAAAGGACAPSGGKPVGDVLAQGATTICCTGP